jgi:hypothetical protein
MLRGKLAAWGLTVVLVGLVLWPLLRPAGADGYPLSSYPMFARGRESRVLGLDQALWKRGDGVLQPLPPAALGVHTELQAMSSIGTALGRKIGPALCQQIARRIAADASRYPGATEVELCHSSFDILAYFTGQSAPQRRSVLVRCAVPR